MISGNNKAKCVHWCTNDFPDIDWQSVLFSDEVNISLHRNKVKVWTKYAKRKIPSPTKALSFGVWEAFSSRGIFPLKIFDGRVGCEQYCAILGECLIEQANVHVLLLDGWKLLQDNDDSPYRARDTSVDGRAECGGHTMAKCFTRSQPD